MRRPFLAQDKRTFVDAGTECYQDDLYTIRTEADCIMILLGSLIIYSFNGVVKTVTDSDLSTSKYVFF